MANSFESSRGNSDESEIRQDGFEFKSAGKKYINQNYKRICLALGIEGESLGIIKRQANQEKQLPDIQGELSLEQVNFYRQHYGFDSLSQDEYESMKSEKQPEPEVFPEPEIEGSEDKKLTRADFGDIPEDPYNIKNNDLEALNSLFDAKRDVFPNSQYVDIRDWAEWTPIEVVAPENPNGKWLITKGVNHELVGDFDSETQANTEFDRIKNEDKQKALDLLRKARNFAIGVDLDTLWTDPVDVRSTDEEVDTNVQAPDISSENGGEALPKSDELVDEIATQESSSVDKNSGSLQQELDRLIEVEAQKLQREQTTENISYKVDREKLDRFKDNARQAIANYQQFSSEHSSLADKSNHQIQERYQLLEKYAWNSLYSLAHLLDGEIATLPQDRDIQLSHPEGVDIRQYLEARGYKFDENGDITHITDNGVEIELNRAMKTDSLIKSIRPSHIVYDKSISLDNDINYQGYLVRGLNHQTPDFIVGVLDKNNLENVIVDETSQSNRSSKYTQDPWNTESMGDTEFNKIFADSLNKNKEAQGDNEMSYPWVEKAPATNPEAPEQAEVGENLPIDNPDRGSLYYQEIQLWNNIQALENRQKENPKDESVKVELDQAKQAYQEFRTDISNSTEQDKFKKFLELRELYAQAESENTRGRFWKLLGLKKKNNSELEDIRAQYNEALEALLKTETSIEVEGKIKEMFSDEVQRLSRERVVQTKELQEKNQSGLDRALNPLKDRIFNWYINNKSYVGAANLGLFAASTLLAFTGAGIPLAGAVNTLRHAIAYPMAVASGISSRELIRSKFEDENTNFNIDIKKFNLKTNFEFLKFKGGITKLVDKSLQNNYIQNASDEDLSKLVSTLESYYGLNGGKFTELNQQKAYEMGLNELGSRLERANNQNADEQDISSESNSVDGLDYKFDFNNTKEFKIKTVDGLVTRISQDRISALNAQKNKRLVANIAGTALGSSLLFNLVAQDLQFNKPNLGDSASTTGEIRPKPTTGGATPDTQAPGAVPGSSGGASAPEAGAGVTKTIPDASPAGTGAEATEALRQQAAAAAEKAQELAQDVSNLDSGETIWSQASKWLGPDASQGQIQQAVENYLQSQSGQESIFELAQQTEGGRELLSQWGIDNTGEMAGLSKEQLYEVSKYLGEGKLDGLTGLSLDNLDALEQAEYVAPSPTEATTIEPGSTETPAPPSGTEATGAKPPAPSSPPVTEAPVEAPVNTSQFTKSLSEAIGANNLTDSQIGSVLEAYADTEQGRESLYNMIITSEANNSNISDLLTEYNVIDIYDFAELSDNQLYALAQEVGVENLDKLPGFELNEIILSKFEDAPDTVELVKGLSPLDAVQRYIANELGDLPYDSSLSKNIVDNILDTPEGKDWFLKSITENPDGAPAKGDIRFMNARLFFSRNGITQGSDIDWNKLDQLRNGFVKHKIFWQDFPFKVDDKTVNLSLSRLLKPGPMPGIKDAVRQVLTRQ